MSEWHYLDGIASNGSIEICYRDVAEEYPGLEPVVPISLEVGDGDTMVIVIPLHVMTEVVRRMNEGDK